MTLVLTRLAAFAGRHWLRLLIIVGGLMLLTQRQVNFSIQLGKPGARPEQQLAPAAEPTAAGTEPPILTEREPIAAESGGFLGLFNIFGGAEEADLYTRLERRSEAEIEAFVTRFSHVAEAEQEKFGVPSSIILGTAILFSEAGTSAAAQQANSYFGLLCGPDWNGLTVDAGGQCLRRYENAWTSFRDLSLYLTSGKHAPLTQFGPRDYRRWAAGMEELGFNATDELAEQLLRTIDRYQLFRFD